MIKYLRSNRRFIIIVIVLLLVVVGMHLRIKWRSESGFSGDETHQLSRMDHGFYTAIGLCRTNVQFPGDFALIYPFYQLFGKNKWGLAIPHIIITIIGFYLLYILCQKYFKTIWAYLITFTLFAYNYNLVYHAFAIRPYGVIVTLSIAGFLLMQYIFEKETPSLIKRIFITIFIFTILSFHLFSAYILFFSYIFHFLFSRRGKSVKYVFLKHLKYYSVAIVIVFPVWYWSFRDSFTPTFASVANPFEFIPLGIVPILKGVFGNLTGPRRFYPLLSGIIICFLIPHRDWLKQMMFFIILIIVPIALLLLACIHFQYWFMQRLFIWAIPLFIFFLGWSWDCIIVYFTGKFKAYKVKQSQSL